MEVENNLLSILNYEKFDLVSLFLKNRKPIYYGVRYHQAQSEKEKEQILEDMKGLGLTMGKRKERGGKRRTRNEEAE
jgi:hypothetical protein